ncbi:MAG: cytochrome c-type biogenesis protein CcmH, partial [gamma proteobacterium symbiont of Ctena orbiculata]
YSFDEPGKAEDFRDIIEEMRCLVCQNESLR